MVMTRRKINTEEERYGGYADINSLNNFDAYYDAQDEYLTEFDRNSYEDIESSFSAQNEHLNEYESDLLNRLQRNIPQNKTYNSTNNKSLQKFSIGSKSNNLISKNLSNMQKFSMLLIYFLVVAILLTVIISTAFAGTTTIPESQYVNAQVVENLPPIPNNINDMMLSSVTGESKDVNLIQPSNEQNNGESNLDWFDNFCRFIESVVGG